MSDQKYVFHSQDLHEFFKDNTRPVRHKTQNKVNRDTGDQYDYDDAVQKLERDALLIAQMNSQYRMKKNLRSLTNL